MRWTRWALAAIAAAALGCDGEMDRTAGGEQGDGDSPGTPLDDGGRIPESGLDAAVLVDGSVDDGPTLDGGDGAVDGGDGAVDGGDGAVDGGDGAVDGGDGGRSEAGVDARTM